MSNFDVDHFNHCNMRSYAYNTMTQVYDRIREYTIILARALERGDTNDILFDNYNTEFDHFVMGIISYYIRQPIYDHRALLFITLWRRIIEQMNDEVMDTGVENPDDRDFIILNIDMQRAANHFNILHTTVI